MINATLDQIVEKLARARASGALPFGLSEHQWRMDPPLPAFEVAIVEAGLGVTLPEEYSAFLTRVGNGPAGPAYGLYSLAQALEEAGTGRYPWIVGEAFPHVEAYNPDTDPAVIAEWNRLDALGVPDDAVEDPYEMRRAGTLPLCHEGCDYYHLLVVSGPARGTMWMDGRAADAGFHPLGVTFLQWYERWIDHVLGGGRGTWWFGAAVAPPA